MEPGVARPLLLSQADEDLRVALRALLRALLRSPGALYNPVYVGPLRRVEPLRLEVAACIEDEARRRAVLGDSSNRSAPVLIEAWAYADTGSHGPALIVASVGEATMLLRGGVKLDEGVQLVIWGSAGVPDLPPFLQSSIRDGGLYFDPGEHRGLAGGWSMGAALSRSLEGSFKVANPTVVVGSPATASVLAAEAQLRLEVARCALVENLPVGELPVEGAWTTWPSRSAAILRIDRMVEEGRRRKVMDVVAGMVGRGILVVMILDGENYQCLQDDPTWHLFAARSALVRAVEDGEPDDAPWPVVGHLLLGAPTRGQEVAQTLSFHLETVPLEELLQLADVWGRSGRLILYSEERLGWIEVDGDLVVSAVRMGDSDALTGAEVITGRIRSMAMWGSGQVVFVASPEASGRRSTRRDGVPLGVLAFDLTRLSDERRAGKTPLADEVVELPPLKPHKIAEGLLRWGLGSAATALLQRAERRSGWGVEEDLLLGHLTAERNPAEAVARLRHGVLRLASEDAGSAVRDALQIDATLNALLLEVRGGQTRATAAWGMVDRWLEAGGEGWVVTEKHAAILFELATRAREDEAAEHFWRRLVQIGGESHPLARSLAVHRARGLEVSRNTFGSSRDQSRRVVFQDDAGERALIGPRGVDG